MINLPPLHASQRIDVKLLPEVLKTWQVGQILQSRARTSSNADGELQLQIGRHIFDARSKAPINAGDNLQLQVARLGAEPLLKILTEPVKTDAATLFLRQFPPQPASLKSLVNLINTALPEITQPGKQPLTELRPVIDVVNKILSLVVKNEQPLAKDIEQFLQRSGFNLEQQLAKQQPLGNNLKQNLLQLSQQMNNLQQQIAAPAIKSAGTNSAADIDQLATQLLNSNQPARLASLLLSHLAPEETNRFLQSLSLPDKSVLLPVRFNTLLALMQQLPMKQLQPVQQWLQVLPLLHEIRQLTEQSLNTITNQQLQSVTADADSAFLLLFNLLVAKTPDWIDLFNIKLTRESRDDEEAPHWKVTVQMDLPAMGKVEARLILSGSKLHTAISAESSLTHGLIDENLPILHQALVSAGFEVATLSSQQQVITPLEQRTSLHGPLLDDSA